MHSPYKPKQTLFFVFLLWLITISTISAQSLDSQNRIDQAELFLDSGNYTKALELSQIAVIEGNKTNAYFPTSKGLIILAKAQIYLQQFEEATKNLSHALELIPDNKINAVSRAQIYLAFATLYRSQRRFPEALEYSKNAVTLAPENKQILAEHHLNFGRILYTSGYDLSAIIELEKAEKLLDAERITSAKLDVYRFLALTWWAKLNYPTALRYTKRWQAAAEKSVFKRSYRQALFDASTILSESGQSAAAIEALEKGLELSLINEDFYQAGTFLTSLLLNALNNDNAAKATTYLQQLDKVNRNDSYSFEILLGQAIIAAYSGEDEKSKRLFSMLEKEENSSEFILPGWKAKIAKRNKNWRELIEANKVLLDLTLQNNFRDQLPAIHLDFAATFFHLDDKKSAREHLEKSLAYVEEIRQSENTDLSLGLLETYHNAYRLLAQINAGDPAKAFEMADYLKARILKDKINESVSNDSTLITADVRGKLEELSAKYESGEKVTDEIEKIEKFANSKINKLNLTAPDLSNLDKIPDLDGAAIVSYFFDLDKKLVAFIWEKDKLLRTVNLAISEDEAVTLALSTEKKIKSFIFFKRDSKEIYDRLLKPLEIKARHLIIVPDKALWKIPFQALSADGGKYLIEEKLISYAPSISILTEQLKSPKPVRRTLQAFANSNYDNRILQHVNAEAESVARVYNSKPLLNATVADFMRFSDKADISHFSMHAQVNKEHLLESFLGFRKSRDDDGRLTVEEILSIKMKKGSLAFLASCDTNNVLSGEGLVSLAWAMMAADATTVISAQWEADDKSTEIFTKAFYVHYNQGNSSAESLQKASIELIRNKSGNMHEPYYWGEFTLNGDFR